MTYGDPPTTLVLVSVSMARCSRAALNDDVDYDWNLPVQCRWRRRRVSRRRVRSRPSSPISSRVLNAVQLASH
jgi:hypothetical protein